jgi:hypothetical protein
VRAQYAAAWGMLLLHTFAKCSKQPDLDRLLQRDRGDLLHAFLDHLGREEVSLALSGAIHAACLVCVCVRACVRVCVGGECVSERAG